MNKQQRSDIAFLFSIVIGVGLGLLVKRITIGLFIGLLIGGMIFLTGWLRNTRK